MLFSKPMLQTGFCDMERYLRAFWVVYMENEWYSVQMGFMVQFLAEHLIDVYSYLMNQSRSSILDAES
jgi:hypothetical protein